MTFTVIAIFKTLHSKKPKCKLNQSLLNSSPSGHTCSRHAAHQQTIQHSKVQASALLPEWFEVGPDSSSFCKPRGTFWMRALNWNLCGCAFRNLQQVLRRLKPNRVPLLETLKAHVMIFFGNCEEMSLWHVAKASHTWGLTCKLPESNADTVRNFILWASFIWSLRTCHKLTMQRKRTTLLGCDSIDVAFSCLLPLGTVPLHHDRLECVPLLGNDDSRYFRMIAEEESHRFQNFHRLAKFEGFLHLHVNEVHLLQKRWSDQLQSFHFVATKTSDPSLGSKLSNQRFQVISMVSHEKKVDLIFPMAWTPTKTSLGMASMLSSPVARRSCDK